MALISMAAIYIRLCKIIVMPSSRGVFSISFLTCEKGLKYFCTIARTQLLIPLDVFNTVIKIQTLSFQKKILLNFCNYFSHRETSNAVLNFLYNTIIPYHNDEVNFIFPNSIVCIKFCLFGIDLQLSCCYYELIFFLNLLFYN